MPEDEIIDFGEPVDFSKDIEAIHIGIAEKLKSSNQPPAKTKVGKFVAIFVAITFVLGILWIIFMTIQFYDFFTP